MKKKDGKIIASLTEVKNKTGDIFALADEFGEVLLTSYNKPRYKIVKIDISDVIDLGDDGSTVEPVKTKSAAKEVSEVKVKEVEAKQQVTPVETPEKNVRTDRIDFTPWDRDNSAETSFVKNATKKLI